MAKRFVLRRQIRCDRASSVWDAVELADGRPVALKLLRIDGNDPVGVHRMLEEARLLSGLKHPCIVRLLDHGDSPDTGPFLVLEPWAGPTFEELSKKHPGGIPGALAVKLVLPVANALSAMHSRGILHRDVKTSHVVLDESRSGAHVPKLVDFGIALRPDGPRLTGNHQLLGSLKNLAPEQVLSKHRPDERADVWGLATMLFEMLHGAPPFHGESLREMAAHLLSKDPVQSPRLSREEPELWAILAAALEKNIQLRTKSIRAFGRDLARWAIRSGTAVDVTGRKLDVQWLREE